MSGESDKLAFDAASTPNAANSGDSAAIAKMAASVHTLDGFLREMKARFPAGRLRSGADGELMRQSFGLDLIHIPYTSAGLAGGDVASGRKGAIDRARFRSGWKHAGGIQKANRP